MGKRVLGTRDSRLGQEAAVWDTDGETGMAAVTQESSPTSEHPSLAFLPRISEGLFCEAGKWKDLSTFSLQGSGVNFPVSCLPSLGDILSAVKVKTVSCPVPSCHFWRKLHRRFFTAPHLLLSGLEVLPGADLSHCQNRPFIDKTSLNAVFCRALRLLKTICLSLVYLNCLILAVYY